MLLSDLFDQFTYGELSQLELAGVDDSGITVDNHKRIIPHVNLAITELHKRFCLKKEELHLACVDHIQMYHLTKEYAATNIASTQPVKYIHDTIFQPFQNNVLKVEKVFNEDGQELHLNENDPYIIQTETLQRSRKAWTVNTPSYNTIQIPYPMITNSLLVEYRANHPKIEIANLDPSNTEIDIPPQLIEALLQYVAARAYTSLGGDSAQEGNNYMTKFEASILNIERLGLLNSNNTTNQKLEVNGWR